MHLSVSLTHRLPGLALDVSFEAAGGVTALFGRSGAGKTTIVNAIAGLLQPDTGRIMLGDTILTDTSQSISMPPHRRQIGYVFQDGRLFPHLTVAGNLAYGQRFAAGRPGEPQDRIVDLLGLRQLLDRRPARLSGGEKSRVAIGRAVLSAPRLLLLDEPLAALDAARKNDILPYLERLRDATGLPMVFVSHSAAEVARLATRVVVIDGGRAVAEGPPSEILSDPEAVRGIGWREAGAVLTGTVTAQHIDGLTEIAVSAGQLFLPRLRVSVGAQVRVRIEAQDIMLARDRPVGFSALNVLPGTVLDLDRGRGPSVLVRLRAGEDTLLARITARSADRLGLAPGVACFAVTKSVAVARADVGVAVGP